MPPLQAMLKSNSALAQPTCWDLQFQVPQYFIQVRDISDKFTMAFELKNAGQHKIFVEYDPARVGPEDRNSFTISASLKTKVWKTYFLSGIFLNYSKLH